tara:strand:+ start:891 stop:2429 length:1539 start_codon:yes stop_codon:yes gene_type:complete
MAEKKELGTVISTMDSPSPSGLDFVATEGIVHRGQFVEMDYSEGTLIALVTNVIKTNRYFERADSVKEFESNGSALFEQFPTTEWEYLVAKTKPLGVFSKELTKRATYPPSPGTKVRLADNKNLERFLNFDMENGLMLGNIEYHDLDVKLSLSSLLKKHLAILALSGAGKSYLVSVLLEELLDRKREAGRIATIVLDPHGEYSSFAEPASEGKTDYSNRTKLIKAWDIRIGVPKLSVGILAGIIPGLSSAQKRDLGKIITKLRSEMKNGLGPFDLHDVLDALNNYDNIKENTKIALGGWISNLIELGIFGKTDSPSIFDLLKPGNLTVIDLSDLTNVRKKQIIVSYFAQRLFYERRNNTIPPFLLVLEEAHQFVPEKAGKDAAISRSIIRTIAREGRKFGASLCLVSQRPVQLDTTALSQCNTHIILRITNPYDLKHIGESSEGLDSKSQEMITSLRVGEALVVGEATHYPLFFKVRKRKSQESKHEISLEGAALRFEEKKAKNDSETAELL